MQISVVREESVRKYYVSNIIISNDKLYVSDDAKINRDKWDLVYFL